ncbi:S8 family serine peptidase [Miltoncostaea oceani]|uniref:S8 family serine peptidase n=1 Tax=Miltoncostaea oceani TaxID=2843216 RepID=UPI001C3DBB03|nr:S8 family serine peptidase [Miltoncostaea oceani]
MISGRTSPRGRHGRRVVRALVATAVAAVAAVAAPSALAGTTPGLDARLADAGAGDRIAVVATLGPQVDGGAYEGRPEVLLRALRRTAARTQADVADAVDGPVRSFWLVNAIAFHGTPGEIAAVAADPAVDVVDVDAPVRIADAAATAATPFPDAGSGDWGLAATRVPAAWAAFGVRGGGVRVGTIDTGVDPAARALAGKVVAWRDFVGGGATPYDDNGHGTHTAGTIAGGAEGGAPIGVAPEARLVVARAMGADGVGAGSALLAAAQWMTDPDGDPATADQPAVVNNSWAATDPNDTWFRPMIRRWLELGIVPVFAAGNTGPGAGTIGSPAGYPEALAVGALDQSDAVPSFSGRGPITWDDRDGLGPARGTLLPKPDVAAPGVGITSSVGSGYLAYSGTSMAAPHVAGLAALVRQAAPALTPQAVADAIRAGAVDVGTPGVDPASGAGRIDAVRTIESVLGPAPDTTWTRTPAATTNARVLEYAVALTGGVAVRTRVDGGAWSEASPQTTIALTLPEGRHVVEAQAIDAAGVADRSPARHTVLVDRTRPRPVITITGHGTAATFRARVADARTGTLRWSFGDGETARGSRVTRRFGEARARRIVLSVRDAAGNEGFAVRAYRPRAATAVRSLRVTPTASRRGGSVRVSGRLVRPARLQATLRPVRTPAAAAAIRGLAASFTPARIGAPVRRASRPASGGGFRITVSARGLRPGAYVLELRAPERGTDLGALRLTRRVQVE